MTAPLLPGAGNESIYAAILARLDAHELQQHYAPLFRGRLELARDTLTDAVAALQQLQEIHASVKALGHPQSNTVTRSTAPFMPLADQIVDAQQHLIQAIVESLEESESATAAPVREASGYETVEGSSAWLRLTDDARCCCHPDSYARAVG